MQTQSSQPIAMSDLQAVRDFLLSGQEIPRSLRPGRPAERRRHVPTAVPVHNGIVRARSRAIAKD